MTGEEKKLVSHEEFKVWALSAGMNCSLFYFTFVGKNKNKNKKINININKNKQKQQAPLMI